MPLPTPRPLPPPDPRECAPPCLAPGRFIVAQPADLETALMLVCLLEEVAEAGVAVATPYTALTRGDWIVWN